MKINIFPIIYNHILSLYNAKTNKISWIDIFTFYFFPILFGVACYFLGVSFKSDVFNVSITFFGIFLALLLNIQVAIFGIFTRERKISDDPYQVSIQIESLKMRINLLSELNTNISYLIVVSVISLLLMLLFFIFYDIFSKYIPTITTILYIHFILTFIMIVKRSYVLFQGEYTDNYV